MEPGILNVGEVLKQYEAKRDKKFDPKNFMLAHDPAVSLSIRAQLANIKGEDRIFTDGRRYGDVSAAASYMCEAVKKEITIHDFINYPPSGKPREVRRPGIRSEYVSFIGWYPQEARKYRLVCYNSELFFGESFASVIVFDAEDDHFKAHVIPEERDGARMLQKGDLVIFLK